MQLIKDIMWDWLPIKLCTPQQILCNYCTSLNKKGRSRFVFLKNVGCRFVRYLHVKSMVDSYSSHPVCQSLEAMLDQQLSQEAVGQVSSEPTDFGSQTLSAIHDLSFRTCIQFTYSSCRNAVFGMHSGDIVSAGVVPATGTLLQGGGLSWVILILNFKWQLVGN